MKLKLSALIFSFFYICSANGNEIDDLISKYHWGMQPSDLTSECHILSKEEANPRYICKNEMSISGTSFIIGLNFNNGMGLSSIRLVPKNESENDDEDLFRTECNKTLVGLKNSFGKESIGNDEPIITSDKGNIQIYKDYVWIFSKADVSFLCERVGKEAPGVRKVVASELN